MLKKVFISGFLLIIFFYSRSQSIDSLRLNDNELPPGYQPTGELICKTPHSSSLYKDMGMYESLLGKLNHKYFQSFEKKADSGSILYFEFEKEFQAQAFLDGLLWGADGKPSKSEPDEYFVKGY